MDKSALYSLSYGMYLISAKDGERDTGCIANSVIQITSEPATIAVSLNKDNFTATCIQQTGRLGVSVLSEGALAAFIGNFGFSSGRDRDKFADIPHSAADSGLAIPEEHICAYLEGRVVGQTDCGTHIVFFAELTEARKFDAEAPMTYAYYHRVIKGKAPKNAPTYVAETTESEKKYTCDFCGYVFEGTAEGFAALPDSYVCPFCAAPKSSFSLK